MCEEIGYWIDAKFAVKRNSIEKERELINFL